MSSPSFKDHDLQYLLGNLLRIGVFCSLFIVITGVVIFFFQKGDVVTHFETFDQSKSFSLDAFWSGLCNGSGTSIIALGVMTLIATPVMRVIFAIIGFGKEKDRLYVIISAIVLGIIIISIILGAVF